MVRSQTDAQEEVGWRGAKSAPAMAKEVAHAPARHEASVAARTQISRVHATEVRKELVVVGKTVV